MLDLVKKAMLTGVGYAVKTRNEVEKMARDVAKQSRMSEKEGRKFLDDVRKKYEDAQDKLEARIEKTVKDLLKKGNLATGDDIRALKKEISELKKKIKGASPDK